VQSIIEDCIQLHGSDVGSDDRDFAAWYGLLFLSLLESSFINALGGRWLEACASPTAPMRSIYKLS
jgi:hypothetical protein